MEKVVKKISFKRSTIQLQLCGLLLFLWATMVSAQQDAQYTQYMYNTVSVNPAYAGSRGHMSIAGGKEGFLSLVHLVYLGVCKKAKPSFYPFFLLLVLRKCYV